MFTYEESRDLFSIPYDINILEQVFRVRSGKEEADESNMRPLYNRENKFFKARSLADLVVAVTNAAEKEQLDKEIRRVKRLYKDLSQTYQDSKKREVETASVWR